MIKKAAFVSSCVEYQKCPEPTLPEYAFIGRSNVGKSSLINMLTMRKGLAHVSSTPGKTQVINHFIIDDRWYLVDLPGYGWAQVSKEMKAKWEKMIQQYFINRENLSCVMVLIDVRIEPQKNDLSFIQWLGEKNIPLAIIFTKADKNSETKNGTMIAMFKEALGEIWEELPPMFVSSSETGKGREEIVDFIEKTNRIYLNT